MLKKHLIFLPLFWTEIAKKPTRKIYWKLPLIVQEMLFEGTTSLLKQSLLIEMLKKSTEVENIFALKIFVI